MKVTNGIGLLNQQLDILHTNDLDKQIMHSLKTSTNAMRAAGIESTAKEADNVMVELEDQVRESENLSNIFSSPLEVVDEGTLEMELDAMMQEDVHPEPVLLSSMGDTETPRPALPPSATQVKTHTRESGVVLLE